MRVHTVKKGYNLPIEGEPEKTLEDAPKSSSLGIHPTEFKGIKPKLSVQVNDTVKIGSPLFFDKARPEIQFCSPAAGKVSEIVYGPRRVVETIKITPSGEDAVQHKSFRPAEISSIKREELISLLQGGGLWPAIRQRPFDKIPDSDSTAASIFVNCMDTAPLAGDATYALNNKQEEYKAGIEALKILSDKIHVVGAPEAKDSYFLNVDGVETHTVKGKHPAGLVGTHINLIDPIIPGKTVWYLNARDVVKIGSFLLVGQYPIDSVVVLVGTGLRKRGYFRVNTGANLGELVKDFLEDGELRLISGNILTGKTKISDEYLGFYDDLLTVVQEDRERKFMGWLSPGLNKPTFTRAFLSRLMPGKKFQMGTNLNGEERAFVKTGDYNRVMALDVLPDFLAKAILTEDIDAMEQLGILECSPEDFALCSYICISKIEFTEIIQQGLDLMEKELA